MNPLLAPKALLEPRAGLMYEPCVLWGMGYVTVTATGDVTPPTVVSVVLPKRDDLYNGSRWPIVLTDVCALIQSPNGMSFTGSSLFQQLPIEVGAMGSSRYSFGQISGLVEPRASMDSHESLIMPYVDPAPLFAMPSTPAVTVTTMEQRPVMNTVRWDFEHTLKLPPAAYLEVALSGRPPTVIDTTAINVRADVNFFTEAPRERSQFPGTTITRQEFPIGQHTLPVAQTYYQSAFSGVTVGEGGSTLLNTLPFQGYIPGTVSQLYPSNQVFTPRDALKQQATYALPTMLKELAVSFDQRALDAALIAGGESLTGPLSTQVYSRVRTRNGGTGTYWWRDGAPLAICMPTMTPAVSGKLSRPMALQPNEGLKLTLATNGVRDLAEAFLPFSAILDASGDEVQASQVVFYLSFCGYRVIEA